MLSKNDIKKLYKNFFHQRDNYITYINNIKKKNNNFFSIINITLISNPYISSFSRDWFLKKEKTWTVVLYIKSVVVFYFKCLSKLFVFLLQKFIVQFLFERKKIKRGSILIDVHLLSNKVITSGVYRDDYFPGLYQVLTRKNIPFVFLPRIHGLGYNPVNFIKLLNVLKTSNNIFIYEHELTSYYDILKIFFLILLYPVQIFSLFQKEELFNYHLIKDIQFQSLEAFTRFYSGRKITTIQEISSIISWSECQVIDRAFNFGVREASDKKITGVQAYLNYPSYFNSYVYDADNDNHSSPHKVLVNGDYYILNHFYRRGVSFRYSELFKFVKDKQVQKELLILTSCMLDETQSLIDLIQPLAQENQQFYLLKLHPTQNSNTFQLSKNFELVNNSLYELFQRTQLVVTTGSGTAVEAVACGVSVVIISSQSNLTANPLIAYGKGEIWDIAFSHGEYIDKCEELLQFRKNNIARIQEIASWYKGNFFNEPTEDNIIEAIGLQ